MVGAVVPGTPQTLTLSAKVITVIPVTNTATITHADQFDPDQSNSTGSIAVTPSVQENWSKNIGEV